MRPIGRVTIHCEELEPANDDNAPARTHWAVDLFRVVGKNPAAATSLCQQRIDAGETPPSPIAITVEGPGAIRQEQIQVCAAIKKSCHAAQRKLFLCGVTEGNRKVLADAGLLEGIDPRQIHPSIAALLQRFSDTAPPRPPRRRLPKAAGPATQCVSSAGSDTLAQLIR
jgi:hypothetical protein